jgi:hypothetical protein
LSNPSNPTASEIAVSLAAHDARLADVTAREVARVAWDVGYVVKDCRVLVRRRAAGVVDLYLALLDRRDEPA